MSRPVEQVIPCPKCQKPQDFVEWKSLNVTLNPAEKQPFLDGRLTLFKCSDCGHSAQLVYPFLYHDMQQSFMVWMIPRDAAGNEGKVPEKLPPDMTTKFGDNYRFRLVDTRNQMLEKIFIFDAGFDDRLIELAKLMVQSKMESDRNAASSELFFQGVSGEGDAAMLDFNVLNSKGIGRMSASRDKMLNLLQREFAGALKYPIEGQWPRVDSRFAMELMSLKMSSGQFSAPSAAKPGAEKKRWWQIGK